jgi:glycosyltransferase involved in cell wall biosynthesis
VTAAPRLRVLMIARQLPWPPRQGAAARIWGLLRALAGAHDVTLVAFETEGADLARLRALVEPVVAGPAPERSRLARIRTLLAGDADIADRARSSAFAGVLQGLLRTRTFDVAQIEGLEMAPYLDVLTPPRFAGAVIYDAHNVEHVLQLRAGAASGAGPAALYSRLQAPRLRRLEALTCRRAARVLCVSEVDALALGALACAPVVVPNGVDVDDLAPTADEAPSGPPQIVFTGTMDFRPNADAVEWCARDIWPRIRAVRPDAEFVVVGQRPGPRLRRRHGRDGITITGAVPAVQPFLTRAHVVVAPLRFGSGTRVKLLEAMACARPIVATPLAAEGLAVRDGIELVLADAPDAFARSVLALLADPARARRLARAGQALVRARHDWSAIAPRLLAVYDRLTAVEA